MPLPFLRLFSNNPLKMLFLFLQDGSSNGRATYVIGDQPHVISSPPASAPVVELRAVSAVFQTLRSVPFNLYTDSYYVAQSVDKLETIASIKTQNKEIQGLFIQTQTLIRQRTNPCFIGHIRAHSGLPGRLTEGNTTADQLTKLVALTNVELAEQSHKLHHQNSRSLQGQFQLTKETARQIVKQCPICPVHHSVPHLGVNPRGITPNQLWQMDVTHVPSFGKLQYVPVTIDTFSGFLMAAAQTGEATKHIINHCLHCSSAMGPPEIIKTENGTGHTSKGFQHFCPQFNTTHKTGIPYDPQGQGIVERAQRMLKAQQK